MKVLHDLASRTDIISVTSPLEHLLAMILQEL